MDGIADRRLLFRTTNLLISKLMLEVCNLKEVKFLLHLFRITTPNVIRLTLREGECDSKLISFFIHKEAKATQKYATYNVLMEKGLGASAKTDLLTFSMSLLSVKR